MIYSDFMAESSTATIDAYVAMTGSPYQVLKSGSLRKLKLYAAGDAATALIEDVSVRVRSSSFGGVDVHVSLAGAGLRTAPAFPIPVGEVVCDLPVIAGTPITIELIQRTADTPVTPQYNLFGVFEG